MILILEDQFDRHADLVQEHLKHAGSTWARLDLDTQSLQRTRITARSPRDGRLVLETDGTEVRSSDV